MKTSSAKIQRRSVCYCHDTSWQYPIGSANGSQGRKKNDILLSFHTNWNGVLVDQIAFTRTSTIRKKCKKFWNDDYMVKLVAWPKRNFHITRNKWLLFWKEKKVQGITLTFQKDFSFILLHKTPQKDGIFSILLLVFIPAMKRRRRWERITSLLCHCLQKIQTQAT